MSVTLHRQTRQTFERQYFVVNRALEFFTQKQLAMQIGHEPLLWPIALLKELVDNSLDACEKASVAPEIAVEVEPDALIVRDNGPGLPEAALHQALDYLIRVSDKLQYVSPTRGQLGNALKCIWAAPFVMDGEHGRVEVITGGQHHRIDVTLDRIAQQPHLELSTEPDGLVKTGTLIRLAWPGIAKLPRSDRSPRFLQRPRRSVCPPWSGGCITHDGLRGL